MLLGVAPVLLFGPWMPRWAVFAALVAVPLLWLVRWLVHGSPVCASPLNLPVLILLLMVPVGVWAAASKSLSLPHLYRIILGVALLSAATGTLTSARRLRLMAALLAVAVPALALFALLGTQLSASKLPVLSDLYESIPPTVRPFWRPTGLGPNSVAGPWQCCCRSRLVSPWATSTGGCGSPACWPASLRGLCFCSPSRAARCEGSSVW